MQSQQFQVHATLEDQHWWFVARREIILRVVKLLCSAKPGATIVDVGCGTGANIAALAQQNYRCFGIDTSEEAISIAQKRFPNVTFTLGDAPSYFNAYLYPLVKLRRALNQVTGKTGGWPILTFGCRQPATKINLRHSPPDCAADRTKGLHHSSRPKGGRI